MAVSARSGVELNIAPSPPSLKESSFGPRRAVTENHTDSFKTGRQKTVDRFLKFLRKAHAPFVGRK